MEAGNSLIDLVTNDVDFKHRELRQKATLKITYALLVRKNIVSYNSKYSNNDNL